MVRINYYYAFLNVPSLISFLGVWIGTTSCLQTCEYDQVLEYLGNFDNDCIICRNVEIFKKKIKEKNCERKIKIFWNIEECIYIFMKSWKLINYSTNVYWSFPYIIILITF